MTVSFNVNANNIKLVLSVYIAVAMYSKPRAALVLKNDCVFISVIKKKKKNKNEKFEDAIIS